jgi:polyribonucleotide 5'-hydroxyl-kinase
VERSRQARVESRDQKIREYFYGSAAQFYPHSFEVRFSDVKIFKIGAPALPDSLMPLGMKAEDQLTKLVTVQPSRPIDFLFNLETDKFYFDVPSIAGQQLLHHLISISMAESGEDDIIQTNVTGFICV